MSDSLRISRKFSQRAVMEAIVQSGPISRASIAKQTGLSKQTISEIVRALEQDGWVRETGRTSGHVGRTAVTYELVPDAAYIVAVDLGGTKIRVAITDLACQVFAEEVAPTDRRGGQFVVDQIVAMTFAGGSQRQRIARKKIRLAVIGVPGAPNSKTGRVLLAPNIADFDKMDVAAAFEKAFGIDVMLENDVNLAVLRRKLAGPGTGHRQSRLYRGRHRYRRRPDGRRSAGARRDRMPPANWASCRSAPIPSSRNRCAPAPSSGSSPRWHGAALRCRSGQAPYCAGHLRAGSKPARKLRLRRWTKPPDILRAASARSRPLPIRKRSSWAARSAFARRY